MVLEPVVRYRYLDGEVRSCSREFSSKRKCRIDPPMSDLPSRRAGPDSLGNMNLEPRLAPILKRPWKRTRTSRRTTGRQGRPGPAKSRHVTHPGTLP
ncbi:hypothetical protein NEUTE1DRAFT_43084 [Neurospora tetrasperma FGSC 2508]|uniref:Uncharacterized protein n=1 Tax=Neurospora tetrasperma (strain FGSC 2508 / ATCC MYA-4615 / P0657) TaxID=510951 RepID=F8MM28_NEUT8|nr:uncharacterized protein NEUTE1DRAFT_43084 [Neurospora tetrasperma FGSC 2508]EGO57702.1 hypothetical protein NEUTE1DRAFT_43084 [Neurospora tetrasperma FGSC 2508]EGZ72028.1 hypothetical protein NEUTE2DRAFT_129403 [Neurospora tetrasperma FGSC 2509]